MKKLSELMKKKWFRTLITILLLVVIAWISGRLEGSDQGTTPTPTQMVSQEGDGQTPTTTPTDTPEATETPKPTNTPKATNTPAPTKTPTPTEEPEVIQYTFRSQSQLDSHFEKHGHEMGASSAEEYLAMANRVIRSEDALHKLEAEDNDHIYYLVETNEFVVLSQDGYIRTYFLPSAGLDYYERQ